MVTQNFLEISVAGTITYDDVTFVDSIGVVTARSGIELVLVVSLLSLQSRQQLQLQLQQVLLTLILL